MKKIVNLLFISFLIIQNLFGQVDTRWRGILENSQQNNSMIDSKLFQLGQLAAIDLADANTKADNMLLRSRIEGTTKVINAEIVYKNNYESADELPDINVSFLESLGFKIETVWKNRASVWVRPDQIIQLGSKLPSDYFMFGVNTIREDNEGPELMNSDSYSGASRGGNGIRIAIIDSEFGSLQNSINNGHCKTPSYMWSGGSGGKTVAQISGGGDHGLACFETVYDHAPNATYELYLTGNVTERANAINQCVTNGVDVISMSMSAYNLGWADNTGALCVAANNAANNGVLFFTSCGNRALTHWEGSFEDDDSDNIHEWSGTDESNNRTVPNGEWAVVDLAWNPVANSNYDVYIRRTSDNAILASSTNAGLTFEDAAWFNNTGASVGVYIEVRKVGSASPTFEIFSHDGTSSYQYSVASGSNTTPSNSTNLNVVSVGALPRTSYNSAAGTTGIIANYSSQGPTNGGNLAPKVCSPTNTTYSAGSFGGTSCATPNAAGMAAAFWSAHNYLDATGVRQILFRKAQLYKDWGTAGTDNIYGNGGLFLYDYFANTRYMYRSANNTTGLTTRPYYNFSQAQTNTPNGGRVMMLGGNYADNVTLGTGGGLNKNITYRSLIVASEADF